ncbi:hypothetical protein QJQ45_009271 [Haematococcus lacustris]|nr:hypothetical protein QJQ45_009271 [Haematococcus lacustris]
MPGQVPGQTSGSADRDHTSAAGEREDQFADAGRQASILRHAAALHIPVRQVARPAEMFEMEDLDRYDLVLCLDRGIRDTILDQLANQSFRTYYEEKATLVCLADRECWSRALRLLAVWLAGCEGAVCLLTSFSAYESDRTMLAKGGFALLPAQLCVILGQGLRASKAMVDIPRPQLSDSDTKRSQRTEAEQVAEPTQPTKGKGKAQGKAAKAKPAPQPGRWLDRDCNAALNMQRIGVSKWRPLELCY